MQASRIIATAALLFATSANGALAAAAPAPASSVPLAPTAPAAAAQTPPPGAPIPGFCVFSYDLALAQSAVGKALDARLQQLASQVQAELGPEQTTLQNDARTLQGQIPAPPAQPSADVQTRANALNQRIQAFQQKQQLRQAELEQTQNVQLRRVVDQMNPLIVQVYNTRRCAVVARADSLLAANPAMDITNDVVTALNARMSTITFDRERIDPNTGGPATAAPAAPAR